MRLTFRVSLNVSDNGIHRLHHSLPKFTPQWFIDVLSLESRFRGFAGSLKSVFVVSLWNACPDNHDEDAEAPGPMCWRGGQRHDRKGHWSKTLGRIVNGAGLNPGMDH